MTRLPWFLTPSNPVGPRPTAWGVVLLLVLSAICVFLAPRAMPSSYSWRSHVISESAAQGVPAAWIARLGFLSFGFAVLWLVVFLRPIWARGTTWMFLLFGLFMVATAAFSHKPWLPEAPFDSFEDFLHSITATGMGFAFSLGVLARLFQRQREEWLARVLDWLALLVATILPLAGQVWPSVAGLLQRSLFAVAYCWLAHEALTAHPRLYPSPRRGKS